MCSKPNQIPQNEIISSATNFNIFFHLSVLFIFVDKLLLSIFSLQVLQVCGEVCVQGASTVVTQRLRRVGASCDDPPTTLPRPLGHRPTPPPGPPGHPTGPLPPPTLLLPCIYLLFNPADNLVSTLSDRRCINNANVPFLCVHCQI